MADTDNKRGGATDRRGHANTNGARAEKIRLDSSEFVARLRRLRFFLLNIVDHPSMVIRKQERVLAHVHNIGGPAIQSPVLQKAGDEVLHKPSLSHSHQTVASP